ncbi:AAA family ATPase [Pseudoruegeria sp. HB172150]|uniref:helix-turn-helix transcriptional regulator n=1 Tax=Pseudoruegeria sp. HB172150 TaxID=2721164 RepID=UPI00155331B4
MTKGDLLERDNDLAALEAAFADACAGTGRIVLVSGEAGIGKTSLVESFAARHHDTARVLRGYCDPLLTPLALGPLHDISRSLGTDLAAQIDRGARTSTLFAQLLDTLLAPIRPAILVVEDIHWADEATLDLLKYLGRRLDAARVLLIATYRDDEVQRHDALRLLLGDLATVRIVERLQLARLSRDAVRALARDRAGDTDAIYSQTGGNPFFVTEVIASEASGVPATVRDAVLGRAARLAPGGMAMLDLAAVIGARTEYALLEQFPDIAAAGLPECLALGLLQDTGTGVAFRHELARNAVLEAIDTLRRRALCRDVLAGAIRAGYAEQGYAARLAHYAEGAADAGAVIRYADAAGRTASRVGAHREAVAHFHSVLRFSDGRSTAERATAATNYARECAVVDQLADAIAGYRQAVALWSDLDDPLKHGETLAALAWPLVRHGATAEADTAAAEAIALLEPLGPTRQLAHAYRTQAHLRMLDRDTARAVEIGGKAIAMAGGLGDIPTLAGAEMVVGAARLVSDDAGGRAQLDRCLDLARDNGLDELTALARMNLGSAYGEQYRFAEAEQELLIGLAFTRDHDLDHSGHYMSSWLALTLLFQGRWKEAAERAADLLDQPDLAAISRIMALVALGRIRTRRGDPGAREALDEALTLARSTATLQRLAPVHAARAEMEWFAGDPGAVSAEASAVFDLAAARRHAWHSGEFLYWRSLAGETLSHCDWAAAPYALQIAGNWKAAAGLWRARGCPYEEARALAAGSQTARLRALELFDALGAAPAAASLRRTMRADGRRQVPRGPRASTRNNPFGLTNREMTTLGYLVRGFSNAGIADELFISAKTVDHHVSAILGKLGAASRKDAAEIAVQEGLYAKNGEEPA